MSNAERPTYSINVEGVPDKARDAIVQLGMSMKIHTWVDGQRILYTATPDNSSELMCDLRHYGYALISEIVGDQVKRNE